MKTEDIETENRREPPLDEAEGTMVCPPLEPIKDAPPPRKRKPSAFRVLPRAVLMQGEPVASMKAGRTWIASDKCQDGEYAIVCVREGHAKTTETVSRAKPIKV